MHATIAQLAINRLMFIPLAIHPLNHVVPGRRPSPQLRLIPRSSYTVVVKYNSIADASAFFYKNFRALNRAFLLGQFYQREQRVIHRHRDAKLRSAPRYVSVQCINFGRTAAT